MKRAITILMIALAGTASATSYGPWDNCDVPVYTTPMYLFDDPRVVAVLSDEMIRELVQDVYDAYERMSELHAYLHSLPDSRVSKNELDTSFLANEMIEAAVLYRKRVWVTNASSIGEIRYSLVNEAFSEVSRSMFKGLDPRPTHVHRTICEEDWGSAQIVAEETVE